MKTGFIENVTTMSLNTKFTPKKKANCKNTVGAAHKNAWNEPAPVPTSFRQTSLYDMLY